MPRMKIGILSTLLAVTLALAVLATSAQADANVVYIFEFDIIPGKEQEFWKFMKEEGAPFWLQFPEVKKYEVYTKIGGNCAYEGRVEVDSFAFIDKVFKHPQVGVISNKTASMTINTQRRLMKLQAVYEDKE
jgi:hypothetical protein